MSKGSIIALVVVIVIIVGAVVYFVAQNSASAPITVSSAGVQASGTPPGVVAGASTTSVPFAGSSYAQYAYLISTGTLTAATVQALNGFALQTSTNPDGSTEYTLQAQNPEYQTQTYAVEPGEQLYFIEHSAGDDVNGVDRFPGDDSAVLVDQNGYIVQVGSPAPQGSPPPGKG